LHVFEDESAYKADPQEAAATQVPPNEFFKKNKLAAQVLQLVLK
jgi:hypothetical protein